MPDLSRRGFLRGSLLTAGAGAVASRAAAEEAAAPSAEGLDKVPVAFVLNGEDRALEVHPDERAVDVVRNRLGLTGTKEACGHGACGACTVLVNGTPEVSCLLPATALEGAQVTTVEGLGEELHPVQRAFMDRDALQCGFCTPGFVVEATAFHDAWRAAHGEEEPSTDAVAAALAGHLCRCGAYAAIIAAVQAACRGEHDGSAVLPDRVEARDKVTGKAVYTVDVKLDGLLEGRFLRSPHAHAELKAFDDSAARALPGVEAVVRFVKDGQRVRFAGQEVAAVAAVDAHTAEQALALIKVDYEVLPAILRMEEALTKDAPVVWPKRGRKGVPNHNESPLTPTPWTGNLRGPVDMSFFASPGKADDIFESPPADAVVVRDVWRTQTQCHTALEPHAAVARWTDDGGVEVWASTQTVSFLATDLADHLGLRPSKVRVRCDHVGGGFGAKALLQMETRCAAELAKAAGKPVRVALTREEELITGGVRPGVSFDLGMAATRKGELLATRSTAFGDGGVSVGGATSLFLRMMYPQGAKHLEDYDVTTHTPGGKPFRAPGGPPAYFALEQAVDQLAWELRADPVELRRKWDPHPGRNRLYDWADTIPAWVARPGHRADSGRFRQGIGVAAGCWIAVVEPTSQVQLDASPDGLVLRTAAQDIGNGTRSTLAWALAAELGVQPHDVQVLIGDSVYPHGPITGGSRTTASLAPAVGDAAEQLRQALLDLAVEQLGMPDAVLVPGGIEHSGGVMPFTELLKKAPPMTFVGRRKKDPVGWLSPVAFAGTNVMKVLAGSLQFVRVEVDARLGRVRVLETWTGIASGPLLAPRLARSQIEGAMVQSVGYALYEERRIDPRSGHVLTAGLEDYRLTGIGDIPRMHVHFDEEPYEGVIGGRIGLSELAMVAPPAAIANAVFHATGWRPRSLPIRPDKVLEALS